MAKVVTYDIDGVNIPVTFNTDTDLTDQDILDGREFAIQKKAAQEQQRQEEPGILPSLGRSFARGVGPGLAGIRGAAAGAQLGAAAGPVGGVIGAILGGVGTALGVRYLQDTIADRIAPNSIFGSRSAQLDYEANPWASTIGENLFLAPNPVRLARAGSSLLTSSGRQGLAQAARSFGDEAAMRALPTGSARAFEDIVDIAGGAGVDAGIGLAQGRSAEEILRDVAVGSVFNQTWSDRLASPGRSVIETLSPINRVRIESQAQADADAYLKSEAGREESSRTSAQQAFERAYRTALDARQQDAIFAFTAPSRGGAADQPIVSRESLLPPAGESIPDTVLAPDESGNPAEIGVISRTALPDGTPAYVLEDGRTMPINVLQPLAGSDSPQALSQLNEGLAAIDQGIPAADSADVIQNIINEQNAVAQSPQGANALAADLAAQEASRRPILNPEDLESGLIDAGSPEGDIAAQVETSPAAQSASVIREALLREEASQADAENARQAETQSPQSATELRNYLADVEAGRAPDRAMVLQRLRDEERAASVGEQPGRARPQDVIDRIRRIEQEPLRTEEQVLDDQIIDDVDQTIAVAAADPDTSESAMALAEIRDNVQSERIQDAIQQSASEMGEQPVRQEGTGEQETAPVEQGSQGQEVTQPQEEITNVQDLPEQAQVQNQAPTVEAASEVAQTAPEQEAIVAVENTAEQSFERALREEVKDLPAWTPERINQAMEWYRAGAQGDPPFGKWPVKRAMIASDEAAMRAQQEADAREEALLRQQEAEDAEFDQQTTDVASRRNIEQQLRDEGRLDEDTDDNTLSFSKLDNQAQAIGATRQQIVDSINRVGTTPLTRNIVGDVIVLDDSNSILTDSNFTGRNFSKADIKDMVVTEGFYDPVSGKTAIIASNLRLLPGENLDLAVRRVAVHEKIAHSGFSWMYRNDPMFRTEVDRIIPLLTDEMTKSIADLYPHLKKDPVAFFEEVFASHVQGKDPDQLAKEDSVFRRIWNAIRDSIARLLGRPPSSEYIGRQMDQLARRILTNPRSFSPEAATIPIAESDAPSLRLSKRIDQVEKESQSTEATPENLSKLRKEVETKYKKIGGVYRDYFSNAFSQVADLADGSLRPFLAAFEFNHLKLNKDGSERLEPAYNLTKKMGDDGLISFMLTRMGKTKEARDLWVKHGGEEGGKLYDKTTKVEFPALLKAYQEAGVDIKDAAGTDGLYLPMEVSNATGLRQWLEDNGYSRLYDQAVAEAKAQAIDRNGYIADDYSRGEVESSALAQLFVPGRGKGSATKERSIPVELLPKVLQFYKPAHETLSNYVFNYANNVAAAKFLGKDAISNYRKLLNPQTNREELDLIPQASPIGAQVARLVREGKMNKMEVERLHEILSSRLNYKPDADGVRFVKGFNMPLALGNPFSALRQIPAEIVIGLFRHGWMPIARGLNDSIRNLGISAKDLNIQSDYNIGNPDNAFRNWGNTMAKLSGFRLADMIPANVNINAFVNKLRNMPDDQRVEFIRQYQPLLRKDAAEISDVIKRGEEKGDVDVEFLAFNDLSQVRPVGLSSAPLKFLRNNGLVRIAYNLRTWGLFQLDALKRSSFDQIGQGIRNQNKEQIVRGLSALSWMVGGMSIANASMDTIIDWLMGRESSMPENVADNMVKLMLTNRYQMDQLFGPQADTKAALLGLMNTPLFTVVTSMADNVVRGFHKGDGIPGAVSEAAKLTAEDYNMWRSLPLGIGQYAYWNWSPLSGEKRESVVDRNYSDRISQLTEEMSELRKLRAEGRQAQGKDRRWDQLSDFNKIKKYYTDRAKAVLRDEPNYALAQQYLDELDDIAGSPSTWASKVRMVDRLASLQPHPSSEE